MTHVSKRALDPELLSCAQVSEVTLLRTKLLLGIVVKRGHCLLQKQLCPLMTECKMFRALSEFRCPSLQRLLIIDLPFLMLKTKNTHDAIFSIIER